MPLLSYPHDLHHAGFHVIEKMTVKCPVALFNRRNQRRELFSRLNQKRVFIGDFVVTLAVLKLHPHAVQMNWMFHHRMIYQIEAQPFIMAEEIWTVMLGEFLYRQTKTYSVPYWP